MDTGIHMTAKNEPHEGDTWVRVVGCRFRSQSAEDLGLRLMVLTYEVEKVTPCGVWVRGVNHDRHWVSKDSCKKYAHPSVEEAERSFRARKKKQIKILEAQLKRARLFEKAHLFETVSLDSAFDSLTSGGH